MIKISSYAANQSGKRASWFQKKQLWTKDTRGKGINKNNTNIYFYNYNLPAVATCPNAPQSCRKVCFAKKAQIMYPNGSGKTRRNNLNETQKSNFVNDMVSEINCIYEN